MRAFHTFVLDPMFEVGALPGQFAPAEHAQRALERMQFGEQRRRVVARGGIAQHLDRPRAGMAERLDELGRHRLRAERRIVVRAILRTRRALPADFAQDARQPAQRQRLDGHLANTQRGAAAALVERRVGRHRHDRRAGPALAHDAGQHVTVHARHVQVGHYRVEARVRERCQRLDAVGHEARLAAQQGELLGEQLLVDLVVLGDQHLQAQLPGRRAGRRGRRRGRGAGCRHEIRRDQRRALHDMFERRAQAERRMAGHRQHAADPHRLQGAVLAAVDHRLAILDQAVLAGRRPVVALAADHQHAAARVVDPVGMASCLERGAPGGDQVRGALVPVVLGREQDHGRAFQRGDVLNQRHAGRILAIERHAHGEAAALPRFALHVDRAAHLRDQPLAEREAQAGAAEASRDRGIGLHEGIEERREMGRLDADAGIGHLDHQHAAARAW